MLPISRNKKLVFWLVDFEKTSFGDMIRKLVKNNLWINCKILKWDKVPIRQWNNQGLTKQEVVCWM